MEPTINSLKENYKKLTDDKIIKLATSEAKGLRPEALEILKDEIRTRGLSSDLLKGIEAQLKPLDEQLLQSYCDILQQQPCPTCSSSTQKLNAIIIGQVFSIIIFTNYEKKLKFACPSCLRKAINDATITTSLAGWWGFPWGIIRTIQGLVLNNKMSKQIDSTSPSDIFKSYVFQNIELIETNKTNPKALQNLIKNPLK